MGLLGFGRRQAVGVVPRCRENGCGNDCTADARVGLAGASVGPKTVINVEGAGPEDHAICARNDTVRGRLAEN